MSCPGDRCRPDDNNDGHNNNRRYNYNDDRAFVSPRKGRYCESYKAVWPTDAFRNVAFFLMCIVLKMIWAFVNGVGFIWYLFSNEVIYDEIAFSMDFK